MVANPDSTHIAIDLLLEHIRTEQLSTVIELSQVRFLYEVVASIFYSELDAILPDIWFKHDFDRTLLEVCESEIDKVVEDTVDFF